MRALLVVGVMFLIGGLIHGWIFVPVYMAYIGGLFAGWICWGHQARGQGRQNRKVEETADSSRPQRPACGHAEPGGKNAGSNPALATIIATRAARNIDKWGLQDIETLALAMTEECGEVAQAVLQGRQRSDSTLDHLREEAVDLGALCVQMLALIGTNDTAHQRREAKYGAAAGSTSGGVE